MSRKGKRLLGLGAFLAATTCLTGVAFAQVAPAAVHSSIDANGVDLTDGAYLLPGPAVSVGAGAGALSFRQSYSSASAGWIDNIQGSINVSGTTVTVTLGDNSETFVNSSGTYTSNQAQGSTLALSGSTYTYTQKDGTVVLFSKTYGTANAYGSTLAANEARPTQLTRPAGDQMTYAYTSIPQGSVGSPIPAYRLQAVTSNFGYQLHFTYDDSHGAYTPQQAFLLNVTAINLAHDYCSATVNSCSGLANAWPTITYSETANTYTDPMNRTSTWSVSSTQAWLKKPSGLTTTYNLSAGQVTSFTNGTGTWNYTYVPIGSTLLATATDPNSHAHSVRTVTSTGLVTATRDSLNNATTYGYDTFGRVTQVTYPEGDYAAYVYDDRGNLTSKTLVPKAGSGLSNIVTSATYPTSPCANAVTCNEPTSSNDALGNETDFTYDPTHGGVLTVTLPPPSTGATRPQTRYTYTQQHAWYETSAGTLSQGPAIYKLASISACMTTASCSGGSDEVKATYLYGASGVANNLILTSASTGSGDGVLTATSAATYDIYGNVATAMSPLPGSGQVTTIRYDADREIIGVVGPDPDGTGPLHNRAQRVTHNSDGLVTLLENGTVNSASDTDWAGFSPINQAAAAYDTLDRLIAVSVAASGSTLTLSQQSYDNGNRITCTVVRMNPSKFTSEPASSCTLGTTGVNGADHVASRTYDNANRLLTLTLGYGTSAQTTAETLTYGNDGEVTSLADGRGDLTTFISDGFNRVYRVEYPTPGNGAVSSTTDYEQGAYNAASQITQDRRRDGSLVTFAYDNLLRVETITPPTGQSIISYAYDNMGWQTSAATSSQSLTYAYDALGRQTGQTGPLGTVGYQYDLANRRTQMTWPDGYYVTYDYDLANDLLDVRENGASSGVGVLASFGYDNPGRRTSLTRGNGVGTTYGFDGASNVTSIAHSLLGTGNNETLTYTYDAAYDVLSRTNSNSSYLWSGAYNVNRPYAANGQNQLTLSGSASLSYDGRGNVSSDGTNTYTYDAFNRLTGMNSATLSYYPDSNLFQTVGAGTTTRFLYDGSNIIGEYNSTGTVLERYVFGPGADEPLVWYQGSTTTTRQWLLADHEGSIVGVTNASGTSNAVNTYDDYGIPGASNTGRFQYTGQVWIPEIGMSYYKARVYSPTLGRFLQSDPVGYGNGANLFAYTGNNPTSRRDPSGTTFTGMDGTPTGGFGGDFGSGFGDTFGMGLDNGPGMFGFGDTSDDCPQTANTVSCVLVTAHRSPADPCAGQEFGTCVSGGSQIDFGPERGPGPGGGGGPSSPKLQKVDCSFSQQFDENLGNAASAAQDLGGGAVALGLAAPAAGSLGGPEGAAAGAVVGAPLGVAGASLAQAGEIGGYAAAFDEAIHGRPGDAIAAYMEHTIEGRSATLIEQVVTGHGADAIKSLSGITHHCG